jgi:hypothetical protein
LLTTSSPLSGAQDRIQRLGQFGAGTLQLDAMREGQFSEDGTARRRKADPDLAFVLVTRRSGDGSRLLEAITQVHSAVVLDEETRCNFPDGRLHVIRQPVDCKEELVLLRLDSVLFRRQFAEVKEATDLTPEFG